MQIEKAKENISKLSEKIGEIHLKADSEGRELSNQEVGIITEMELEIEAQRKYLPQRALTVGNFSHNFSTGSTTNTPIIAPVAGRDYRSMFNLGNEPLDSGGFKNAAEFLRVIDSGRYDPRLDIQAAMTEGVPSSGGFSVPTQFGSQWLDSSLPSEIVRNLCKVYGMTSETKEIPGWDGSDMSGGATHGGFTMEFLAESGAASAQTPKMRKITLQAKMAAIYCNASIELVQDGQDFATNLETALKQSIGYGIDRFCIAGSGAGCPQGVLNAACKIQVEKESGQNADTVVYGNLKKMFARQLNPQRAVWLFNANNIPELLEISVAVGTGGSHVPLLNEKDGKFTIFGRPVYFHPAMPALGDEDDCAFVCFDFYGLGLRKEMWIDQSDAPRWDYRERSYRVLMRFDGMCTLNSAVQPEHGDTLSPIVTLAERA
jgi:HK97 family phage major capsid protein